MADEDAELPAQFALISSSHNLAALQTMDMPEIAVASNSYAMTVKLTSEILEALQAHAEAPEGRQPSLRVRLGTTENVLNVDGELHEMRSFAEKPSVCESYVEDEGHFFQVGFVHKKLIVQRDIRKSKAITTATETPKLTTERTSLNSAEVDRLTGSKRRWTQRKPIQLAPKRKKSAPSLTRPNNLAPSLNRSSSSSPSRRRSPLPPANQRYADADAPAGVNPQLSRTISQPPLLSAAAVCKTETNGKKAKPGIKVRTTSSSTATTCNRDLPIQDQVIHVLAIAPMTLESVSKRLGTAGRKLEGVLKTVAKYEAPGRYFLRPSYYARVCFDKWPYSAAEKAKVVSRLETSSSIVDENAGPPSVSASASSSERSEKPKRTSSQTSLDTAPLLDLTDFLGDQDTASKLFRKIDEFKGISSHSDYLECRRLFQEGYPKYKDLDTCLHRIEQKFAELTKETTSAQSASERERAEATLKKAYRDFKPVSSQLKDQFEKVHAGMSRLKTMVREYVISVSHQA